MLGVIFKINFPIVKFELIQKLIFFFLRLIQRDKLIFEKNMDSYFIPSVDYRMYE